MSLGRKQGEDVRLSLVSSDASAGAPIVVADSNGVLRPIQSYERLVIDELHATVLTTTILNVTDPGAGVAAGATLLASFSLNSNSLTYEGEGQNVSPGSTPVATASAAGNITIAGTGRVLTSKTRGVSAGYKALLTPGGTQQKDGV